MSRVRLITKDKKIGKVLFIVEGIRTEINLLRYIFTNIFDYRYEKCDRLGRLSNSKENAEFD